VAIETERKYLVRTCLLPPLGDGKQIVQAYLHVSKQVTIRARIEGESAYITVKGFQDKLSRPEFEYPVPIDDAIFMINSMSPYPIIRKIRREIFCHGKCWQLDEFQEMNAGLWIAEIELTDPDEPVELPPWVSDEVTGDPRYLNSGLSINPYCNWNNGEKMDNLLNT